MGDDDGLVMLGVWIVRAVAASFAMVMTAITTGLAWRLFVTLSGI